MVSRRLAYLLFVLLVGCEGSLSEPGVVGPSPAALPDLGACAAGWHAITSHDASVCEPWPSGARDTACDDDAMHVPGTAGCVRIGPACPADGWPASLPSSRPIRYVDDDAAPGGDGLSPAAAFTTIGAALAVAPANAVIAVAVGTYDEPISVPSGRAVWGACVSGVRLTSSAAASDDVVVDLGARAAELHDVTIDHPARLGVGVNGRGVRIEEVAILGASGVGMFVASGDVTVRGLLVRDGRETAAGLLGHGILAQGGATAAFQNVVLERNRRVAVLAQAAGTLVSLVDAAIVDTQPIADGTWGWGAQATNGATIELHQSVVEDNREAGVTAFASGTTTLLEDVVIRRTAFASDGGLGEAVSAFMAASLDTTRIWIDEAGADGIMLSNAGTTGTFRDVVITATNARPDGTFGGGAVVQDGARGIFERLEIAEMPEAGLVAFGGTLTASDVTVHDVHVNASGGGGSALLARTDATITTRSHLTVTRARVTRFAEAGLTALGASVLDATDVAVEDPLVEAGVGAGAEAGDGARIHLTRAAFDRVRGSGLVATDTNTAIQATDVSIMDTQMRPDGSVGIGVLVADGAYADLREVVIVRAHQMGIMTSGANTTVHAVGIRISEGLPLASGFGGGGALAQLGAALFLSDSTIEDVRFVGVAAANGGSATLDRVSVHGVRIQTPTDPMFAMMSGGFGIVAMYGGDLDASDFEVTDAEVCGVVVGEDHPMLATSVILHAGVIDRVATGACVQVDGYDTRRLEDVEYRDVGVPLMATHYTLPQALPR